MRCGDFRCDLGSGLGIYPNGIEIVRTKKNNNVTKIKWSLNFATATSNWFDNALN